MVVIRSNYIEHAMAFLRHNVFVFKLISQVSVVVCLINIEFCAYYYEWYFFTQHV